ncbi:MAG: hypothetical protein KME26_18730 [Oscillatoria princeps RMCB-10]|nr:hypothetical protein [Oscillatoria princeps RMCB-10]
MELPTLTSRGRSQGFGRSPAMPVLATGLQANIRFLRIKPAHLLPKPRGRPAW